MAYETINGRRYLIDPTPSAAPPVQIRRGDIAGLWTWLQATIERLDKGKPLVYSIAGKGGETEAPTRWDERTRTDVRMFPRTDSDGFPVLNKASLAAQFGFKVDLETSVMPYSMQAEKLIGMHPLALGAWRDDRGLIVVARMIEAIRTDRRNGASYDPAVAEKQAERRAKRAEAKPASDKPKVRRPRKAKPAKLEAIPERWRAEFRQLMDSILPA